jgi:hypothetical protein
MFGFSINRVTLELEAKLRAPNGGAGRGKVERKSYADGREKLTMRVRELDLPDGAMTTVYFGDREVTTLEIARGRGQFRLESRDTPVPTANEGETVRFLHDGIEILSGLFRPD